MKVVPGSYIADYVKKAQPVKKEPVVITAHFPEGDIWPLFIDAAK